MARRWSIQSARLFLLFGACLRAFALQLPAGTEIQIRLTTKVSTQTSKAKDPVEAAVIAPVMVDGQFAIPAGLFESQGSRRGRRDRSGNGRWPIRDSRRRKAARHRRTVHPIRQG